MDVMDKKSAEAALPRWVPDAARNYLQHTEGGLSIRAVARAQDCHPSTVMRQIRRFEGRRDDPLVDAALDDLSAQVAECDLARQESHQMMGRKSATVSPAGLTQARIDQEARRVLRRLCEQGAVMAAARAMETAVVVRVTPEGEQIRTAVLGRDVAQAMALKGWISCADPDGRIVRYVITNAGRAALRRLTAEEENRAVGLGDAPSQPEDAAWDIEGAQQGRAGFRNPAQESPLVGLARRRDKDGKPFLSRKLVTAGEQLREDYELVEAAHGGFAGWDDLLRGQPVGDTALSKGAAAAQSRIGAALAELGPGLGDVALRCCCFLEGLEQTEKTMGWSARSGKIVLRIALERLARHYAATQGPLGPLIG